MINLLYLNIYTLDTCLNNQNNLRNSKKTQVNEMVKLNLNSCRYYAKTKYSDMLKKSSVEIQQELNAKYGRASTSKSVEAKIDNMGTFNPILTEKPVIIKSNVKTTANSALGEKEELNTFSTSASTSKPLGSNVSPVFETGNKALNYSTQRLPDIKKQFNKSTTSVNIIKNVDSELIPHLEFTQDKDGNKFIKLNNYQGLAGFNKLLEDINDILPSFAYNAPFTIEQCCILPIQYLLEFNNILFLLKTNQPLAKAIQISRNNMFEYIITECYPILGPILKIQYSYVSGPDKVKTVMDKIIVNSMLFTHFNFICLHMYPLSIAEDQRKFTSIEDQISHYSLPFLDMIYLRVNNRLSMFYCNIEKYTYIVDNYAFSDKNVMWPIFHKYHAINEKINRLHHMNINANDHIYHTMSDFQSRYFKNMYLCLDLILRDLNKKISLNRSYKVKSHKIKEK